MSIFYILGGPKIKVSKIRDSHLVELQLQLDVPPRCESFKGLQALDRTFSFKGNNPPLTWGFKLR